MGVELESEGQFTFAVPNAGLTAHSGTLTTAASDTPIGSTTIPLIGGTLTGTLNIGDQFTIGGVVYTNLVNATAAANAVTATVAPTSVDIPASTTWSAYLANTYAADMPASLKAQPGLNLAWLTCWSLGTPPSGATAELWFKQPGQPDVVVSMLTPTNFTQVATAVLNAFPQAVTVEGAFPPILLRVLGGGTAGNWVIGWRAF